ncbi:hypothetical protein AAC387_Pa05g3590 [Persea americana]
MGRECNLDLCLLPAGNEANIQSPDSVESRSEEPMENSQKLTIFYNGRVSVCNVTEFQAGAILRLAKQQVNEKMKKNHQVESPSQCQPQSPCEPQAPAATVKRSLQRFLQKRMSRIHSTSPYSS